ncbi:sensor histidine kinase, partial [Planobispora longispora]
MHLQTGDQERAVPGAHGVGHELARADAAGAASPGPATTPPETTPGPVTVHPETAPGPAIPVPATTRPETAPGPVTVHHPETVPDSVLAAFLASPRGLLSVAVAAVSVLLSVAGLVLTVRLPAGAPMEAPAMPDLGAGLTFPLAGVFLLAHRGHAITGWLMCLGGLSCAIRVSFQAMALSAMAAGDLAAAGYLRAIWVVGWAGGGLLLAVLLPLYSPDGRLPSARWRPFAALAVTTSVLGAALMVARPTSPAGLPVPRPIPSPFAVEALAPYYVMAHKAAQNFLLFFVVVAMASQILRFRRADAAGRRQVAWPLSAFAGYVVLLITGPALWLLAVIWTGLIPVAIVFAALRYRLYGIDTVISRAFVAAGLIAAVSAVYFG